VGAPLVQTCSIIEHDLVSPVPELLNPTIIISTHLFGRGGNIIYGTRRDSPIRFY